MGWVFQRCDYFSQWVALECSHVLWKIAARPPWKKFFHAQHGGSAGSFSESLPLPGPQRSICRMGHCPRGCAGRRKGSNLVFLQEQQQLPPTPPPPGQARTFLGWHPQSFCLRRPLGPEFAFPDCPQVMWCCRSWCLGPRLESHCSITIQKVQDGVYLPFVRGGVTFTLD